MAETVVDNVSAFACPGCGQNAALSTKLGKSIACPCGMSHTPKAVLVDSSGDAADPKWHETAVAAGRAARPHGGK